MKMPLFALIVAILVLSQTPLVIALSDYQRGVLDGLSRGWSMGQRYDQALAGEVSLYNQAVADYNAWIEAIFGRNESLMLKTFPQSQKADPYTISRTRAPIHSIDASWNQSEPLLPQPDDLGLIGGYPAETYYSIGPALANF